MAGIRVNNGVKRIEVNDDGDYITLNFSDHDFPNRFFNMLDRVESLASEAETHEKALREKYTENDLHFLREISSFDCEIHRKIMAEVDVLFGQDTCRKVFGDIVPGVELFDDFFQQLMPYFKQFGEERAKRLSKYSAERKGNV